MAKPRPGLVLDGRYVLEKQIGRGGMGTVWTASDEKLMRTVAIKVVSARHAQDEKALKRFEREARSVAKLRSPHIVQVYDYGIDRKNPFMVMELLEGEDLGTRLKREEKLTLSETVRIGWDLGRALATAHAAKVVHRDLKPGNIFIVRHHDEDIAKVFDFGISKALDTLAPQRRLTEVGTLLGTPHYMAPEQVISATQAEPRSDLWSAAVIMFRCCAGRIPFDGEAIEHLLASILYDKPMLPSQVEGVDLPPELDDFFIKALAKEPEQRFRDAVEQAHAFADAAGYERRVSVDLGRQADDDDATTAILEKSRIRQDDKSDDDIAAPTTHQNASIAIPRVPPSRRSLIAIVAAIVFVGGAAALLQSRTTGDAEEPSATPSAAAAEPATEGSTETTVDAPIPSASAPVAETTASLLPSTTTASSPAPSSAPPTGSTRRPTSSAKPPDLFDRPW